MNPTSEDEPDEMAEIAEKIRIVSPFGEWLRKMREAKNFTQEELAKAANNVCTGAYISNLERGQDVGKKGKPTRPSEEIVEGLATALGASVSTARRLAGYDTSGMPDPALDLLDQFREQAVEAVRLVLDLPPERRAEAINILKVMNKENVQIVRGDELKEGDLKRVKNPQGASSDD